METVGVRDKLYVPVLVLLILEHSLEGMEPGAARILGVQFGKADDQENPSEFHMRLIYPNDVNDIHKSTPEHSYQESCRATFLEVQ